MSVNRAQKMNHCENCLSEYLPGASRGHKQRFCSERCRKSSERKRNKAKRKRLEDRRYVERTGLSPLEARCPTCSEVFPRYNDPSNRTGWRRYCSVECRPKRKKEAMMLVCEYCEDPFISNRKKKYCSDRCSTSSRADKRFRGHKISKDEFRELLVSQGGLCKICGDSGNLCIDHDHQTGEVRGLLCGLCNSGLGMFRDNLAHLSKAIEYLRDP